MKYLTNELFEHINRITAIFANDENVVGIFIIGSAASNTMDANSDIDILCVVDNVVLSRESYIDDITSIPIEVLYNSKPELLGYLSEETGGVYRTIAHMISTGMLLINRHAALDEIVVLANDVIKSKTVTTEYQSTMIRYSISDFLSDASREYTAKNYTEFMLYSEKIINNTIEASLRVNNGYFRPPRQLIAWLNKNDTQLTNLLNDFYMPNDADKMQIINQIAQYGLHLLGGELPPKWHLKLS